MVSPGSALPLGCEGKASLLVAVMSGTTARAAARVVARGLPTGGDPARPALKVAGTRGVRSDMVSAIERNVPRRDFREKAILKAFGVMNLS
jgi:hypothetical protein